MNKSVILCGPSGVGKTTIITRFLGRNLEYEEPISYQTRPQRSDDKPNYISLTEGQFEQMEQGGEFFCVSKFLNWKYACSLSNIAAIQKSGKKLIMDYSLDNIDGILPLKKTFGAIFVYVLPPNEIVLSEQLKKRPKSDNIDLRFEKALSELHSRKLNKNWGYIDFELINHDLEDIIINLEELALK
jgi:guanylate kinase